MAPTATKVPDGLFFELSPSIVLLVRVINFLVLLLVVITFVMAMIQGEKNNAYYLLACNIVISGLVGIVVNWWYKGGDLGSEKFWYILVVAGVLAFQCITIDIYIFKVAPEEDVPASTVKPIVNGSTFTWVPFRPTNKTLLYQLVTPDPGPFHNSP